MTTNFTIVSTVGNSQVTHGTDGTEYVRIDHDTGILTLGSVTASHVAVDAPLEAHYGIVPNVFGPGSSLIGPPLRTAVAGISSLPVGSSTTLSMFPSGKSIITMEGSYSVNNVRRSLNFDRNGGGRCWITCSNPTATSITVHNSFTSTEVSSGNLQDIRILLTYY